MDDLTKSYREHLDLFQCYFGDKASVYWTIFRLHQEGASYKKLEKYYYYSPTQISRIVKRVGDFLECPYKYLNVEILEKYLYCNIVWPDILLGYNRSKCSKMAYRILRVAICLAQNERPVIIPRTICISLQPQYKNRDRREKLLVELSNMKASIGRKGMINIFARVYEERGELFLDFTEEVLNKVLKATGRYGIYDDYFVMHNIEKYNRIFDILLRDRIII